MRLYSIGYIEIKEANDHGGYKVGTIKRKNNKHKMLNKFLKVFLIAFTTLMLVVGLGTGIYYLVAKDGKHQSSAETDPTAVDTASGQAEEVELKRITTFAVFGTDVEGYRTDVVMLVFFNKETKKFDIISVPRDTMVTIPDDIYAAINETRSGVSQTIKINEVPAYVEKDKRHESSVAVLENTLGIDIDYYISMNLDGFINIVDLVGPIEVDVPMDMYYEDRIQDLYINLKAGVQELNGEQAEQLMRFRKGYGNGDLGRIETQHAFMQAFMKELLTVENKVNILNIASQAMTYIETDFNTAIDYVNYIDDIATENLSIITLPGESKTIDRSYYIFNPEDTAALLKNITDGTGAVVEETNIEPINPADLVDIKTLGISVQNGTDIGGFAGKFKEILAGEGYSILEAVNYEEKPVETTRLLVPSQKIGEALSEYFKNPLVEVDETMLDQEIQIKVILGESDGGEE